MRSDQPARNDLLVELFSSGVLSEDELKKIYRKHCKRTHPDLTGSDGREFIKIQKEYKEALVVLARLHKHGHFDGPVSSSTLLSPSMALYASLHHYTTAGLHSARVRLKASLKTRNKQIIREVIECAGHYDPDFIPIFTAYNRIFIPKFLEREMRKRLHEASWLFRAGLNAFFDYKLHGDGWARRRCASFLDSTLQVLSQMDRGEARKALTSFTLWIIKEAASVE
jgi:hypothetical protein